MDTQPPALTTPLRAAAGALGVLLATTLTALAPCPAAATDLGGTDDAAPGASMLPAQRVELPWSARPVRRGETPRTTLEIDARGTPALQPPSFDGASTAPAWNAPANDPGHLGVRVVRWSPAGPAGAVGVSLGFSGGLQSAVAPVPGALPVAPQPLRPELGVRWRSDWSGAHRVDVAAWRAGGEAAADSANTDPAALYNARVELQFRDAKRAMGFDLPQGAFGVQLQGGGHLMLRARHGGPMLYYRRQW
jgi:hypothetical protein